MNTIVKKVCNGCGIDVSQQKRIKDQQGRYYCHPCWGSVAKPSAAPPNRPEIPAASVATSVPKAIPSPQPPDQIPPMSPVVPAVVPDSFVKMIAATAKRVLWDNRWGRWGSIATLILIAALAFPAVKAYRTIQDDKAAMDANGKSGADMFKRMAESDERQAEELRKKADAHRATPVQDDSSPVADGPKSKTEAIHADAGIMSLLDQRPELESLIKSGGTQLDAHLQLLFMQDVLTASDLRYIRKFCARISNLPSY